MTAEDNAHEMYIRLRSELNKGSKDIAKILGQNTYNMISRYFPSHSKDALRKITNALSADNFTEEEATLISHALRDSDWEEVRMDLENKSNKKPDYQDLCQLEYKIFG